MSDSITPCSGCAFHPEVEQRLQKLDESDEQLRGLLARGSEVIQALQVQTAGFRDALADLKTHFIQRDAERAHEILESQVRTESLKEAIGALGASVAGLHRVVSAHEGTMDSIKTEMRAGAKEGAREGMRVVMWVVGALAGSPVVLLLLMIVAWYVGVPIPFPGVPAAAPK